MMVMMIMVVFMIMMVMMIVFVFVFMFMVMVMIVLILLHDFLHKLGLEILGILDSLKYLLTVKLIPGCRYYSCLGIVLPYKFYTGIYLLITHLSGTA